jgi:hypothetical protein
MRLKATASLLLMGSVCAQGQANKCGYSQLGNQRKDVATIQRLERVWNEAYLRGDAGLMSCLLAPDFTEIMRSGELKALSDELAMAENNRGKDLKMSEVPRISVLLHENAAVAFGKTIVTSNGEHQIRWYSDTCLWKDGQWHAIFAQQTAAYSH